VYAVDPASLIVLNFFSIFKVASADFAVAVDRFDIFGCFDGEHDIVYS
jgi:hypothetical protein